MSSRCPAVHSFEALPAKAEQGDIPWHLAFTAQGGWERSACVGAKPDQSFDKCLKQTGQSGQGRSACETAPPVA